MSDFGFVSFDRITNTEPDWYRDERGCLKPVIFDTSDVYGIDAQSKIRDLV